MDKGQGRRRLLPVRPVDDDCGRGPRSARSGVANVGQRRAAPGLQHLQPDLHGARADRVHLRDVHAAGGRRDPHGHPGGRRAWARTRLRSSPPTTSCGSRSSAWARSSTRSPDRPPCLTTPSRAGRLRPAPITTAIGRRRAARSVALEHPVDQAVLERLLGREEAVALHVRRAPARSVCPCARRRSRRSARAP